MQRLRACVTGGSRGIGRAVAARFVAAGFETTILGRSRESLDAVVAAGQAHRGIVLDVADTSGLTDFFAAEGFDLVVNNAGGAETGRFAATDLAAFRRMFALNVESAVVACRAALPAMIERKFGRIVNMASMAGLKGYPYVSAYVTAKHALVGLTRALAVEFARSGITVNAVCPGYTDTDLVATGVATIVAKTGRSAAEARAHFEASNPMGRLVRPEEVAEAVFWLVGPGSGAVTGQCIAIAGGES